MNRNVPKGRAYYPPSALPLDTRWISLKSSIKTRFPRRRDLDLLRHILRVFDEVGHPEADLVRKTVVACESGIPFSKAFSSDGKGGYNHSLYRAHQGKVFQWFKRAKKDSFTWPLDVRAALSPLHFDAAVTIFITGRHYPMPEYKKLDRRGKIRIGNEVRVSYFLDVQRGNRPYALTEDKILRSDERTTQ